ncbi:5'-methylthioadenosine/S-adenosylhomocysteine nucleosidase [Buchnera aphidicola]|uniref:5'-methylthioadenosine/S-adenosylhomocysteine nucleosidase n=1 Tax=Buchnera aphidicola TaxID=9 RepID=UPI0034647AF5
MLIMHYAPNIIVNIGSCGAIIQKIKIQDIIIPNQCCYHDVDVSKFHYKMGQVPGYPNFFYTNRLLIKKTVISLKKLNYKYKIGMITTGDTFVSNKVLKKEIIHKFPNAIVADMESCAIAQIAYVFKVPFLIIRFISDFSNENADLDFKKSFLYPSKMISKIIKLTFQQL